MGGVALIALAAGALLLLSRKKKNGNGRKKGSQRYIINAPDCLPSITPEEASAELNSVMEDIFHEYGGRGSLSGSVQDIDFTGILGAAPGVAGTNFAFAMQWTEDVWAQVAPPDCTFEDTFEGLRYWVAVAQENAMRDFGRSPTVAEVVAQIQGDLLPNPQRPVDIANTVVSGIFVNVIMLMALKGYALF